MKSILILAVLLAASCEGQYQREKNGCVGVNQYLCGDVCAKTGSTCTCGQGTFLVGYSDDKTCCAPTGNCKILGNGNAFCTNGSVQDKLKYCPANGRCLVTSAWYASVPCIKNIQDEPQCSQKYRADQVCKGNNLCPL